MSLPKSVRVASFDLLGTIVDWERGLSNALQGVVGVADPRHSRLLVAARADAEWELLESLEAYRPYREVLEESIRRAAARTGLPLAEDAARRVAETLPDWPFFPDAVPALARIAARLPVAIVTNADRPEWERLSARFPFRVSHAVTSTDVEEYKPEADHLLALLHEMALDEEELLHASSFPDYDLVTAEDLGVLRAYVDRHGEPLPGEVTVQVVVKDLAGLADWIEAPAATRRSRGETR